MNTAEPIAAVLDINRLFNEEAANTMSKPQENELIALNKIDDLKNYLINYQYSLVSLMQSLPEASIRELVINRRNPHLAIGKTEVYPCADGVIVKVLNGFTQEIEVNLHSFSNKSVAISLNEETNNIFSFYDPISKLCVQGNTLSLAQDFTVSENLFTLFIEDAPDTFLLPKCSKILLIGWNFLNHKAASSPMELAVEHLQGAFATRNLASRVSANNLLEEFIQLLDTAKKESELQNFLEEHPEFMYPEFENCIPKPNLGGERYPDFAISIPDSGGVQWIFIEIEKVSKKIFTEGEPFQFHHNFTQAKGQLLEWDRIISRDHAFFERRFPGLLKPQYHLIFGRNSELNDARRDMLRVEFSETTNRRFSTYDDLSNRFQRIIQRLGVL